MSKEDSPPEPQEFEWESIVPDIGLETHMRKKWWNYVPNFSKFIGTSTIERTVKENNNPSRPYFTGLKFKLGEDKHTH